LSIALVSKTGKNSGKHQKSVNHPAFWPKYFSGVNARFQCKLQSKLFDVGTNYGKSCQQD